MNQLTRCKRKDKQDDGLKDEDAECSGRSGKLDDKMTNGLCSKVYKEGDEEKKAKRACGKACHRVSRDRSCVEQDIGRHCQRELGKKIRQRRVCVVGPLVPQGKERIRLEEHLFLEK